MTAVRPVRNPVTRLVVRFGAGRLDDVATIAVTAILFAVAWPTLHLTHQVSPPWQPVVAAAATAPLLLQRRLPVVGWTLSAVGASTIGVVITRLDGWTYPWQVVHLMVLGLLLFAVGVRASMSSVVVASVASALLCLAQMPGQDGIGWTFGVLAVTTAALLVRRLRTSRRALAEAEEIGETERARRAILEEKARIARDLHDVVAHTMSMVVVAAQTAPYRIPDVSPAAAAEFDAIGATARAALNEIRGVLGVLRNDAAAGPDGVAVTAPAPGAGDLQAMFEGTRRAGVDLDWNVDGDPSAVSDTVGLVMYRVVQESLANAARHAPGSSVRADIAIGSDRIDIVVVNDVAAETVSTSGGHGLDGMRDRVHAVGGTFSAAHQPDGRYVVRASIATDPAGRGGSVDAVPTAVSGMPA
ncbi:MULTISPECIES: sensor histidine kinase [unclassified Rhodococcus (in: high G+C Gram-positive bacteria)]|uniref:sensor histidine kinase n=1 Tax=unclassified Rhodococcus (in: high G+C Gram-positive bacteria) TaxID=192944 RepID=UPI0009E78516|nr:MULTISPECIES: histidine kinase [unclassified Rhodococcus (in: high G+C Gram-positive bacteria)]